MVYIFTVSDIVQCAVYGTSNFVCSPGRCHISSTSENIVVLYETEVRPLFRGNFTQCFEITDWKMFKEHQIVSVSSSGEFIFDGSHYITMPHAEPLESKLPINKLITKLPQFLLNYDGNITFTKIKGNSDVFICTYKGGMRIKLQVLHCTGKHFETTIHSSYIQEFINNEFIKIHLEDNFPVCIEDLSRRTYIAPCLK